MVTDGTLRCSQAPTIEGPPNSQEGCPAGPQTAEKATRRAQDRLPRRMPKRSQTRKRKQKIPERAPQKSQDAQKTLPCTLARPPRRPKRPPHNSTTVTAKPAPSPPPLSRMSPPSAPIPLLITTGGRLSTGEPRCHVARPILFGARDVRNMLRWLGCGTPRGHLAASSKFVMQECPARQVFTLRLYRRYMGDS